MRLTLKSSMLAVLLTSVMSWAHAAPITFDVALTPTFGNAPAGTGYFTIEGYVGTGYELFTPGGGGGKQLLDLSFTIAGYTFDLGDSQGHPAVSFLNNSLFGIFGFDATADGNPLITLKVSDGYTFRNSAISPPIDGIGSVTAAPTIVPSPVDVPEPSALSVLGLGLLALGFVSLRRRKI